MKYTPGSSGEFNGQHAYGYKSFEMFVQACRDVNAGQQSIANLDESLPTIGTTMCATAILEAGRLSLDNNGAWHDIVYDDMGKPKEIKISR